MVYNLFFHPLRHIPGPWLACSSILPYGIHSRTGNINDWIGQLHAKYGDVVRVNPNELSLISGDTAWQQIYGFRSGKYKDTGIYEKDNSWFVKPINGVWSIFNGNEADHSRMRRSLSHAFSDKALRSQEGLVMSYVDLLAQKLGEHADEGKSVDIMRWYNYTTFDVITDLTFGEPLYCLRDNQYHTWVSMVFAMVKSGATLSIRNRSVVFRWLDKFLGLFVDTQAANRAQEAFFTKAAERVKNRLATDTTRPDFFTHILQNQDNEKAAMTRGELDSNAVVLLAAGSETTATALSGITYLLLRNQPAYKRLTSEIRSAFTSAEQINIDAVNNLPYLIASIQEGLRYYPPAPTGLPRVVPGVGQEISGHYIPGGTSLYMSQHAANHAPRNFTDGDLYVPERWIEKERPEKYESDKRGVVQPFSFGPRNCLGKKYISLPSKL